MSNRRLNFTTLRIDHFCKTRISVFDVGFLAVSIVTGTPNPERFVPTLTGTKIKRIERQNISLLYNESLHLLATSPAAG